MRRFVVVGQTAGASGQFLLDDLPGTSGRLDVLLRCLRAALLVSHGVRIDTVVYLVLLGAGQLPRSVRVDGATARFLRPDERSLAILIRKSLEAHVPVAPGFTSVRPGISVACGGLDAVLADLGNGAQYVLEQGAPDLRQAPLDTGNATFFLGDHLGFDVQTREALTHASSIGLGPVSLHAEDAIVVVANELDRREAIRNAESIASPH
jgi:tRNA (pseudouridine54-N1)-methyltransferase